jgi:HPt (histidine-containing phosphotransfer) domain-containing protein
MTEDLSGIRSPSDGSASAQPAQLGPTCSPSVSAISASATVASATLRQLVEDVGDPAIVQKFVADYLRLLNGRIETLEDQLARVDFEAASISLLSLETSSAMVGGRDVVGAAHDLRMAVDDRQADRVGDLLGRLLNTLSSLEGQLAGVELRPQPTSHPAAE